MTAPAYTAEQLSRSNEVPNVPTARSKQRHCVHRLIITRVYLTAAAFSMRKLHHNGSDAGMHCGRHLVTALQRMEICADVMTRQATQQVGSSSHRCGHS